MSQSKDRQYVSIDWVMKILVSLVAFFLAMTFFTVQQTAKDVGQLKSAVSRLQDHYNDLNHRVNTIELNSK